MNLMQIQDDLQSIPNTPEGMRLLMEYANGSNPSVVPEYVALGELSRRRQFQNIAKQLASSIPTQTVKDQLTQAPQMVNQNAGIAGINPAAPAVPVNPMMNVNNPVAAQERPYGGRTVNMADGGLAAIPGYMQDRLGVPSVPLNNMFNPSSYAGGGIVAFQNNEDQPVDPSMPTNTRAVTSIPRGRRSAEPGFVSTYDRALQSIIDKISKFELIPSQDAELQSLIQEQSARSGRAPTEPYVAVPIPDNGRASPDEITILPPTTGTTNTGELVSSPALAGDFLGADVDAVSPTATTAPRVPAVAPAAAPRGVVPTTGGRPSMDSIDDQLLERRRALLKSAGVSDEPFAEANKRQAALEARQQAKYAQDPLDRIFGSLAAYAKSDPTKGMAGLGTYAEASNMIQKEQTGYRDKQEQAAIDYQIAIGKEKDARARDDVKSVEAARAAQEKSKLDWAKLDLDRSQLGISAANLNIKQLELQLQREKAPLQRQLIEAQIAAEKNKIPTAEERAAIARSRLDETVRSNVEKSMEKDETIKYWSSQRNIADPQTAAVLNSYLEELKEWHLKKALNPEAVIPKPAPPVPGKKKTNIFGSEKREFEGPAWVRPNAPAASAPLPPGVPSGSRAVGTSGGQTVYQSPDGQMFTVQ